MVITIIVLLILAGVTINAITGNENVMEKAKEAKENTQLATEEEQRQLTIVEATMNLNGTKYKSIYKGEEVTVPIPAGFAVSKVDGENTVEDGLVIIDSKGNEFVWIPVKSEEEYQKKIGNTNIIDNVYSDITDISTLQQGDDLDVTCILGENIGSGIQDRPERNIVVNAGGFYVGRYEAGVKLNEKIDSENIPEIVVKKNVQPVRGLGYKYVIDLANNWKVESNVQSGLITGTQWDVMCNFIDWNTTNQDCGTWGNFINTESYKYSGYCSKVNTNDWIKKSNMIKLGDINNVDESCAVFPTGVFLTKNGLDTAQKNIYDIAGNVFEFTTEIPYNNTVSRFGRGGDAGMRSNCATIRKTRGYSWWAQSGYADGFRLVLYVKK